MFDDEFEGHLDDEHLQELKPESAQNLLLNSDLDSYPDSIQNEAVRRYQVVDFVRQRICGGWTQSNIDPLLREYFSENESLSAPYWRTVVRWHKKLSDSNNALISLVDRHHLKGNRSRKSELNTERFFEESIDRFLKAERPSVASAYRFYKDQCLLHSKDYQSSYRPNV